jgi:hypothetical protein
MLLGHVSLIAHLVKLKFGRVIEVCLWSGAWMVVGLGGMHLAMDPCMTVALSDVVALRAGLVRSMS